jgi:hypothetical protein
MANDTPSVHWVLHKRFLHRRIALLIDGREGSNRQLLEVAQGLDELLPNQFLCFTSKQHRRMDYSSGSVKVDNAQR